MAISPERRQFIEEQALATREKVNYEITRESLEDFAFRELLVGQISYGNGASQPGVMGKERLWYGSTIKETELLYLAHEIAHVLLDSSSQEEANLFSRLVNQKSKAEYQFLWELDGIAQFVVYWPVYLFLGKKQRAEYLYNHSTRRKNPYLTEE